MENPGAKTLCKEFAEVCYDTNHSARSAFCGGKGKLYCACHVKYCCVECRKLDWTRHKQVCAVRETVVIDSVLTDLAPFHAVKDENAGDFETVLKALKLSQKALPVPVPVPVLDILLLVAAGTRDDMVNRGGFRAVVEVMGKFEDDANIQQSRALGLYLRFYVKCSEHGFDSREQLMHDFYSAGGGDTVSKAM